MNAFKSYFDCLRFAANASSSGSFVAGFVIRTRVLNGSVLLAAVNALGSKVSPFAVFWPSA